MRAIRADRQRNSETLEGIRALRQGKCTSRYLNELISLCETIQVASKCGLGQLSPNILIAINKHFRDEILARPVVGHH